MARKTLRPLVRGGGFYPSRKWTPLVYAGGYTTANGGEEPAPPPIEKTVTGNPIHILDALAKPAQALSVKLEPIKDLHGYDNPWPAGGGKNKLPLGTKASETIYGVTAKLEDGVITLSGTATANAEFVFPLITSVDLSPSTNKIAFFNSVSNSDVFLYFMRSGTSVHYWQMSPVNRVASSWTDTGNEVVDSIMVRVYSGTNASMTVSPMLIAAAETSDSFTPYSNICPISGHTDADVTRTGKNLYSRDNGQYNVPVYGADGTSASYPDVCAVWIPVKPNTTYTVASAGTESTTFYVRWINCAADKSFISRPGPTFSSTQLPLSFVTPANCHWVEVAVNQYPVSKISLNDWGISVIATADTDYSPYVGTTYPIPLGQTVYGGTLDVLTGVLTVDRAIWTKNTADMDNSDDTPGWRNSGIKDLIGSGVNAEFSNQIMNIGKYFSANTNGSNDILFLRTARYNKTQTEWIALAIDVQIVVDLATPQTIQLTPTQVELLLGENNIWSDGTMTLVYLADGNASEIEALNILLGGRYVNNHGEDEPTDREALDILLGNTR